MAWSGGVRIHRQITELTGHCLSSNHGRFSLGSVSFESPGNLAIVGQVASTGTVWDRKAIEAVNIKTRTAQAIFIISA